MELDLDWEEISDLETQYEGDELFRHIEEEYDVPDIVQSGTVDGTDVTLVGVHHDGRRSREMVRRVIRTEEPDIVGAELTPLAMLSAKLFGNVNSGSELVVAAHAAREVGAHAVAIDKNRTRLLLRALLKYPRLMLFGFLMAQVSVASILALVFLQSIVGLFTTPLLGAAFTLATVTAFVIMRFPFALRTKEYDFGRIHYQFVKHRAGECSCNDRDFIATVVGDWREAHMEKRVRKLTPEADNIVLVVGAAHVEPLTERFGGEWTPQPSYVESHDAKLS